MNFRKLSLCTLVLLGHFLLAQKVAYNLPDPITQEQFRIDFQKVSASTSSYYVNYKIQNTGKGILVIDRSLTSLKQSEGVAYPASDTYVLNSGKSKTVYNQFRVKAPIQANADIMKLSLGGLSYAKYGTPLKTESLTPVEKEVTNFGPFSVKVMEYNVYSDRVYVNLKCTYNGDIETLGYIDLTGIEVSGGEAEIVKKGDVVFSGKSYSFSVNITPDGSEISIDFKEAFQQMKLESIQLEEITIKRVGYEEPEEQEDEVEDEEQVEKTEKVTELSYSDFTTLKKDVELELNSGGKPVDMAYEFLLEKGMISTAQVIDILATFNLDGTRLKFAKMAYSFTSDKPKYHMVVGKLAYTKNKQILEEFLEQQ